MSLRFLTLQIGLLDIPYPDAMPAVVLHARCVKRGGSLPVMPSQQEIPVPFFLERQAESARFPPGLLEQQKGDGKIGIVLPYSRAYAGGGKAFQGIAHNGPYLLSHHARQE